MSGLELFDLVCLLTALVLFILTGVGIVTARLNLLALGLAAWVLVPLVHVIVSAGH